MEHKRSQRWVIEEWKGKHSNFKCNHQKENQTTIFALNQFISEKFQIKAFLSK